MMWQEFVTAIALMLVLEGIIPFLNPRAMRELFARLASVDDRTLRMTGFISMGIGVAILLLMR